MMKKILLPLVVIIIVGLATFFYVTRPVDTSETVPFENDMAGGNGSETSYSIDPSRSKAEYRLDEMLNGSPKTVIGTTSNVSGKVDINAEDLSNPTLGVISIDARTFKTDSDRRDSAVVRLILKSETAGNEYITFTPTDIEGLPESPEANTDYSFTVKGKLKVSGVEKDMSFATTARMNEAGEIVGRATATVSRADYSLVVPSLPFLADVDEEVLLSLDFTLVR